MITSSKLIVDGVVGRSKRRSTAFTRATSSRVANGFGNVIVRSQLESQYAVVLPARAVKKMMGIVDKAAFERNRLQTSSPSRLEP